MDTFYYFPCL